MEKYKDLYYKVRKNKKHFEKMLEKAEKCNNPTKKVELARQAVKYAVFNNGGYFTNSRLEKIFIDCAQNIDIENYNIKYKENSFLHVLTTGYNTGGHTRVVERWIKNAPNNQIHSVAILKPDKNYTSIDDIVVNGNVYRFSKKDIIQNALRLRELSLNYKYIVLHVHMQDPTALIAYGTEKIQRPILFYNHASHLFWVGKNVSDVIMDIIKNDIVTKKYRRIENTYFLGIPTESVEIKKYNKIEKRQKLNLPLDKKIIISAGSAGKYKPIDGDNYIDAISQILDDDTICYFIGPSIKDAYWKKVYEKSNHRIVPLGYINFDDGFSDYLACADLYIDSYPFGGGTALIDAICTDIPVLSLKSYYSQLDYLIETSAYCQNKEEFMLKIKRILKDKNYSNQIKQELQYNLNRYQSLEAWNARIRNLIRNLDYSHKVGDTNVEDFCKITDLAVADNILANDKFDKINLIDKIRKSKISKIFMMN